MGFQEIGFIFRMIFVYRFNLKRINQAHLKSSDQEVR